MIKSKISKDVLNYKNALEKVRFDNDVENNSELIHYFDEAIDRAEKNESIVMINSRLNYQLMNYIEVHHFKAPKAIINFMRNNKGDLSTIGLPGMSVSWGKD